VRCGRRGRDRVAATERARGGPSGQQRRGRVCTVARALSSTAAAAAVMAAAAGRPNDRPLEGGGSPFSHTPRVGAYSVCLFRVVVIIK